MATRKRQQPTYAERVAHIGAALIVAVVLVALVNPWASVLLLAAVAGLGYLTWLVRPIEEHTEQIGKREYSRLRKEASTPHIVMLGPNADGHDLRRYKKDADWRKRHNIEDEKIPF
jgi:hypothetical protein